MKRVIWKFELDFLKPYQLIEMPRYGEILSVQIQKDILCLWALVDPDGEKEERYFEIFMTGRPIPVDMGVERVYINTFQLDDFVGHVYERIN
jgi:hypothetical protein